MRQVSRLHFWNGRPRFVRGIFAAWLRLVSGSAVCLWSLMTLGRQVVMEFEEGRK